MISPLLLGIGFLAGLLTIVSPCILPVLPAVIASGVTTGGRRRAFAIATGLALAFGFTSLFSIRLLQALGLPLGLRYDIAIGVLILLAFGFIVPQLGELIERPFSRIGLKRSPDSTRSGFVLGATLGLLYLPCGGPILATISTVGAKSGSFGASAVELTVAYSLGIALPIFGLVLLTGRLTATTTWLRTHATNVRRTGGVLLLASAVAIFFGAATSLQSVVPSYTASIEHKLTKTCTSTGNALEKISNPNESTSAKKLQCAAQAARAKPLVLAPTPSPSASPSRAAASSADTEDQTTPQDPSAQVEAVPAVSASSLTPLGMAPNFADVTHWLNTNGASINLSQLKGHVVLIDFWTYSCINCLRSLPHVEAWYSRYHSAGLDVIGVHTPEFDFEHVESNVQAAVQRLGVKYPVAMDNNYGTWDAWGNNSWPAEYLIDATGQVRYSSIGEGDYGTTEGAIRSLLAANGAKLPPTAAVANLTPDEPSTPESYLGYERLARYDGTKIVQNKQTQYTPATSLTANHLTYSGQWTVQKQDIVAGANAKLQFKVKASDIYLVLSGTGTATATLNGKALPTQQVAGVPELHTILGGATVKQGTLDMSFSPGVTAYAFTFG